jgi:hypothetical protein
MHVNDELAGWRTIIVLPIVFLLPGSDGDPTVGLGAGRRSIWPAPSIWTATHPPRLSEVVDMCMVHWHRAGDVSQAKIEADCQKAGGMWDSKMNMCMEKKQ